MAGPSTATGLLALSILLAQATLGLTENATDAADPPASPTVPVPVAPAPPSDNSTSQAGPAANATHSPNNTTTTGTGNDTVASTTAIPQTAAPPPLPVCPDRKALISNITGGVKISIVVTAKTIAKSPNGKTNPAPNTTANVNVNPTTDNPLNNSSVTNGSLAPTIPSTTPIPSPTTPTPDLYEYTVYYESITHTDMKTFTGNSDDLTQLEPCSQYNFTVNAFINGIAACQMGPLSHRTGHIAEKDFTPKWDEFAENMCFMSSWLISEKTTCFKSNASCEMARYIVGPDKCSVTIDQHTPPVDAIELVYGNTAPPDIEWANQPPECPHKNLIVKCTDAYLTHQDYKPFQSYNCTGTYNTTGFNMTKQIVANIECVVDVVVSKAGKSSTSITLNSRPHSSCQQLGIDFTSYTTCKNRNTKRQVGLPSGSSHTVSGLEPFTDYTCTVTPQYKFNDTVNLETLQKAKDIHVKTESDKPTGLRPIHPIETSQNNALHVKCGGVDKWNGDKGYYKATIEPEDKEATQRDRCDFTLEGLRYSTQYEILIIAVNGQGDESDSQTFTASTGYNDKALIGILAFLIILTSIALLFVLYKIYVLQKQRNNDHPDEVIPLAPNPLMTVEPIAAETLLDVYKKKIADEGRLFLAEFQSVPRIFSNFTVKVAKNTENQPKNRYVDILPYDYNRVQLSSNGGEPGADYINASFIEGFKEQKKYIAAQGPKEETMADFWRMVWEQKSSIIVMVTRCEEGNRSKCAQYWPSMDRETEIYGDFVLKIKKEDICPDYIIRHLTIINRKDKSAEREVTHIQFTSWPDHGVPSEPHLLLKLRRRVNSFSNLFSGPIVVHCSAGVGRTGTYIGIDAMLESLDTEGVMDIYGYVVKMRRQRCLMVQVEAQYILIHQALIEFNQFGDTEIPLAELHSCLSTLQQRDSPTDPTLLEVEFQRLPKYRNWRTFNTAVSEENKKKNRYSTALPYDFNRVLVKLEEEKSNDDEDDDDDEDYSSDDDDEEDSTQYINASYIDGYWSPRSLIAAQGPLGDTVPEFWQMVYQKRVKNIVMLSQCTEGSEELCAEYWSKEKKSYKDISVEETDCISSAAYTKRTLQLQHAKRKDGRQVQQYHFQGWPEKRVKKAQETDDKKEEEEEEKEKRDGLPEHPQELVELIRSIRKTIGKTRAERSTPVLVHCHDGTSRSGVFCALWNIVDSATTESLVDIFQVCKSLRKERQGMIADYEQYQFLYKAVEGAFPAQNGEVKQTPTTAPAADFLQIISEVPASATTDDHQVEPKDAAPAAAAEAAEPKEDEQKEKKEEKEADGAVETISLLPEGGASEASEQSSSANGPTITVEV